LTSERDGVEWSVSPPGRFIPWDRSLGLPKSRSERGGEEMNLRRVTDLELT